MAKRPAPTPRPTRPAPRRISDAPTFLKGNRAYLLAVRKALTVALKEGSAVVGCESEEGEDIATTIVCSRRSGRRIGFVPPSQDGS